MAGASSPVTFVIPDIGSNIGSAYRSVQRLPAASLQGVRSQYHLLKCTQQHFGIYRFGKVRVKTCALAVSAMIGIEPASSRSRARIAFVALRPSISGMRISIRIAS